MGNKNVFRRYELKYLLKTEQYEELKKLMGAYMKGDKFGESDICNLYFDTPDFLLIRRSIEKPVYKEKLRVRSYGVATGNSEVFVEIKKKFDKIVYKRRISTTESNVRNVLSGNCENSTQIGKEIDYFMKFYKELAPRVFISYRREAFYAKCDKDFRMTFDRNILWRDYDLSLKSGIYGTPVLPEGCVLLEIKTATSIPLWLTGFLSRNKIFKTSFSKYGNAYKQKVALAAQGGKNAA